MSRQPSVSVIIIFLNAERFLPEAVASVFTQTYQAWELLLVDDGSTDLSTDLAQGYTAQHPERVRYLEHAGHENRGMSASRNLGLSQARGEYVAFLDADDVWLERKLERQMAIMDARPGVDMVYGNTQFWRSWTGNPEDRQRDLPRGIGIEPNTLFKPPALLTRCYPLGEAPSPATCSMLMRRKIVEQVGGFEPVFRGLFEDQAFLAKLYLHAAIFAADECWDKYRLHPDSCVSVAMRDGQHKAARQFFLQWLADYLVAQGIKDDAVWRALRQALWPYRHPVLHGLSAGALRLRQQVGWLGHTTQMMNSKLRRVITRQSTGKLTADPNPLHVADRFAVGVVTLRWEAKSVEAIEVRIGAPDGQLFTRAGPQGSTATGPWVSDGMVFYLQDVSDGLPLTAANTLGYVRVSVVADASAAANPSVPAPTAEAAPSASNDHLPVLEEETPAPPVGDVNFGSLRRLKPISRLWGYDRGCPVDRYYIENFLARYAADIRGRVLEIGDNTYTRQFGSDRVTHSDVLHVKEGNPQATIIGDLTSADHIPSAVFDCVILAQTLHLIYDVRAAIQTLYRVLKPGGILLATFPGSITQITDTQWASYWSWGFTNLSARRLFAEVFPAENIQVEAYGNVLTAISFLQGLAAEELSQEELDYCDPGYQVSLTVRAVKPA